MAKILCPNNQYTGVSASVTFVNGVGETNNEYLIDWFKKHGYEVQEEEQETETSVFDNMTVEELKTYALEKKINIGNATKKESILKKILEDEKSE